MPNRSKDIRYLNKDFEGIRDDLSTFADNYFDVDIDSDEIANLFTELNAYVGDVLSLYTDRQFREGFIQYAQDEANVKDIARMLGYIPKENRPASVMLDVFIVAPVRRVDINEAVCQTVDSLSGEVVPCQGVVGNGSSPVTEDLLEPDFRRIPVIKEGMVVQSNSNPNIEFRTIREVDFSVVRFDDPLTVEIYETDEATGNPTSYLLKKQVPAVAGRLSSTVVQVNDPEPFRRIEISDPNLIRVERITDGEGNRWYEVPYLAQEVVMREFRNTRELDPNFAQYEDVESMLDLFRTSRRFVVRRNRQGIPFVEFGSGGGEEIKDVIRNADSIGNDNILPIQQIQQPVDPQNFLKTDAFGLAPFNTELKIDYIVGGGTESNVPPGDLQSIKEIEFDDTDNVLTSVENSIAVTNPVSATGGKGPETIEEIRRNTRASFGGQRRIVTKEDYETRVMSMPTKYGNIAKAYARTVEDSIETDLYILSYDANKRLGPANDATKENLETLLSQYRMATDSINIKDGFIVNITVDFEIIVFSTFSKRNVLEQALIRAREWFDTDNWMFNEPIIRGEFVREINEIEGVQNVSSLSIENVSGGKYSNNVYDIQSATRNDIIYPSIDPSVFEVRFPNSDLCGSAI